jgi:hypothetical protein
MKKAKIYHVPAGNAGAYAWKWRAIETGPESAAFERYFDCVTDARLQGYEVEATHAEGIKAPGGAAYKLRDRHTGGE